MQDQIQSMVDDICNQPVRFVGPLTETTLRDIIQPLKKQVCFLLDDYNEINSVPQIVEELIQRNCLYQHCLVVAVRTNRTREIRKYATTTSSVAKFPLSSTLYVLKELFSYNSDLVEQLLFQLEFGKSMQTILKTPLFMVSLAAYWVQHPEGNIISDKAIFKAYLRYHLLKYSEKREHVLAMFSSCGELALTCLFKPSFDFTEYDLSSEAGVEGDESVRLSLLSKFTAQRLHPVYKFFHPLFQEFLAGRRLSELLVSDEKEKLEQGLQYLQQINTCRKVAGCYNFFLVYTCSFSSKAVPQIISYLFKLIDFKESLESQSENYERLQHHSDLPIRMFFTDQLSFIDPKLLLPACNLGVLLNLEELILPAGKGIKSAAKLIIQQCLHLLHLRCFLFILCLDDDSLLEIAKVANWRFPEAWKALTFLVNHDVTETGWRNFFRTLSNMPALKELDISPMFPHQIKASASTVTAFVQCVSQLSGLGTIVMTGWLLDAEDLKMFGIMKEQHPHSKSLKLSRNGSWHFHQFFKTRKV